MRNNAVKRALRAEVEVFVWKLVLYKSVKIRVKNRAPLPIFRMDPNESDVEGSLSSPEGLNVYDYEPEEVDHHMEVNNTLRVKMEDDGHPEMLAKLQRPGQDERELRDHNERLQHETAAVIKRQAREADSFMRVRTTPTSLVTSSASNLSSPPPAFPVFIPQLHNRLLPTTTTPCSSPGSSTSQSSPSSSVNNIAASTDRETPGQDPSKYSSEELFRQVCH
ncbi:uncharacterized protein LOC143239666 [Tachypleus tridentatus]|uniref:uncharacterized protein LOC143239666 n=1 Tax=Tachypleus tridentatus TaxID=6853 RepID=UPI003FCF178F